MSNGIFTHFDEDTPSIGELLFNRYCEYSGGASYFSHLPDDVRAAWDLVAYLFVRDVLVHMATKQTEGTLPAPSFLRGNRSRVVGFQVIPEDPGSWHLMVEVNREGAEAFRFGYGPEPREEE